MAKTELLAPVGSIEAFYAALSHGADALYFAGKKFGARAHLENFSEDEIIDMIEEAHRHHVKVYMTVNIIIKDEEFLEATQWVDFLVTHGADAIIVQDWGILHYIRHTYPSFPIHASTQMNTHDVTQAHKLYELGVQRIIFARETSLDVIREVIRTIPIETEVFVHGALCICHSGNCYLSSLIGKRSGNRGRCAQPCRLPYELEGVTEEAYLLSPKDLMTLDDLQLLVDANITSLKIEGRMKRPEYVGVTTQAYRRALDNLPNADAEKQMKATFNREFTKGFIFNESNSDLTNINSPNHIGIPVGKVIGYANGWIEVALNDSITVNDG
ncbi:MAG: peptidase U32 family protein, partial [Bacilli bacterium]